MATTVITIGNTKVKLLGISAMLADAVASHRMQDKHQRAPQRFMMSPNLFCALHREEPYYYFKSVENKPNVVIFKAVIEIWLNPAVKYPFYVGQDGTKHYI